MNHDPEEEIKKKKKPPAILSLQTFNYSGAKDPSSTLSIISNLYSCSEPLWDFRVADQSISLRDGEPGNAREGGEVTRSLT